MFDYMPSWLSAICGAIGSGIIWAIGGFDIPLTWLLIFCIIDYITGTVSAFKSGIWSSNVGAMGIVKKLMIFVFVILAHGIDETAGINYIRQAIIIAYLINESGSIIENIELLGYGKLIPTILRNGIKILAMKQNAVLDMATGKKQPTEQVQPTEQAQNVQNSEISPQDSLPYTEEKAPQKPEEK